MPQDVLVVGELTDGALAATTAELLGLASRLADGGGVHVTLLGAGAEAAAAAAFAQGASRAYVGVDAQFDVFRSDQWLAGVEAALDAAQPAVVLVAQTMVGRDLAPRLAFRRGTAAAMDCLRVEMTAGGLRATRPAYGGNALATYSFITAPAVVTVRAKSQEPLPAQAGASGDTVPLPAAAASRTVVVSRDAAASEGLQLQDAQIVVSGGRGPRCVRRLPAGRGAGGRPRTGARRGRLLTRRMRPRLVPTQPAGGAHRQGGEPGPLRGGRHLRRQPAHGRLQRREGDRRHQPRPRGEHL